VQAGDVLPASREGRGQPVDADLRVAEDQEPIEPELVGELDERLDLVLLGHEIDHLAHRLDRLEVGANGHVSRVALHEPIADAQDRVRHGRAEQRRLPVARAARQDRLDVDDEPHVQHPIRLVQDHGMHPVQAQLAATNEVEHASRRPDHDLRAALQPLDLLVHRRSAVDGHGANATKLTDAADLLVHLHAQLACRGEDQRLDVRA
jgi:hypothetical protein